MRHQPLDLADFVLAWGFLIERFDPHHERVRLPAHRAVDGWNPGTDDRGWYCPEKNPRPNKDWHDEYCDPALNQLRRLRGTTRLPRGVVALRERLWTCLCKRVFRNQLRERLGDEYPQQGERYSRLQTLIAARIADRLRACYPRAATHEKKRNWDSSTARAQYVWTPYRLEVQLARRRPRFTRGDTYSGKYGLVLPPDYYSTVFLAGLVTVDEHFICDARPVRDFDLPMGIESAWRVLRLVCKEQVEAFDQYVEPALVVIHTNDPAKKPRFAPDESAAFGQLAGASKSTAYTKARRKVPPTKGGTK